MIGFVKIIRELGDKVYSHFDPNRNVPPPLSDFLEPTEETRAQFQERCKKAYRLSTNGSFIESVQNIFRSSVQPAYLLNTLQEHMSWVNSIALSSNGEWLASGSDDQTIKIWHTATGICINTLKGQNSPIYSVDFSPNGKTLISGSIDGSVCIWEIERQEKYEIVRANHNAVYTVSFSPNGSLFALGTREGTIQIGDTEEKKCTLTLSPNKDAVRSIAFSPDGNLLAAGYQSGHIQFWNPHNGECIRTLTKKAGAVNSVVFSPDGNSLAAGCENGDIEIWERDTGECTKTLKGSERPIYTVAFHPEGKALVSGSRCGNNSVQIWDLASDQSKYTLGEEHNDDVNSVIFTPDGTSFISGSRDRRIKMWRMTPCVGEYIVQTLSKEGLPSSYIEHSNKLIAVAITSIFETTMQTVKSLLAIDQPEISLAYLKQRCEWMQNETFPVEIKERIEAIFYKLIGSSDLITPPQLEDLNEEWMKKWHTAVLKWEDSKQRKSPLAQAMNLMTVFTSKIPPI